MADAVEVPRLGSVKDDDVMMERGEHIAGLQLVALPEGSGPALGRLQRSAGRIEAETVAGLNPG